MAGQQTETIRSVFRKEQLDKKDVTVVRNYIAGLLAEIDSLLFTINLLNTRIKELDEENQGLRYL